MMPPKSHPRWKQLVTGDLKHPFKALSGAMCVSRIVRFVQKEGATPEAIELAISDLQEFFSKLEGPLAEDLKEIFGEGVGHAENDR